MLGLEDNAISSWSEVLRLAGLPQLTRLQLSGNPISSIACPQHPISPAALWAADPPATAPSQQQQQQSTAAGPAGGDALVNRQQQQQQHGLLVSCFSTADGLCQQLAMKSFLQQSTAA